MILPNGELCDACKYVMTHFTWHRCRGVPFAVNHYKLVPCCAEHTALHEAAKNARIPR